MITCNYYNSKSNFMQNYKEKYTTTIELAKMLGISRVAAAKKVKKLIEQGTVKASEKGKGT